MDVPMLARGNCWWCLLELGLVCIRKESKKYYIINILNLLRHIGSERDGGRQRDDFSWKGTLKLVRRWLRFDNPPPRHQERPLLFRTWLMATEYFVPPQLRSATLARCKAKTHLQVTSVLSKTSTTPVSPYSSSCKPPAVNRTIFQELDDKV
jgi:hypothetical protein